MKKGTQAAWVRVSATAAILQLLLAVLATTTAGAAAADPDPRPNVLLVVLDDANTELGVYGHPVVRTPNLDRLAARGVCFTAAYCAYPECNQSRVSLLTGLRPTTTRYLDNYRVFRDPSMLGIPILPLLLKTNGYTTGGAGKVAHLNYAQPDSWNEYYLTHHDPAPARPPNPVPSEPHSVVYGGAYMNGPNGELGSLIDTKHVSRVMDMAGRFPEPFFLAVGLQQTHVPWLYPEALLAYYDPTVDVPPLPWEEQANTWQKNVYWRASESYIYLDPAWQAEPDGGRATATVTYWRCHTYDDREIGRLLDTLDASGLAERTIVVVVADNGWSGGYHRRWNKADLFDWSARVPMIIAVPWLRSGHGRSCPRPVEMIDLYPTIADLCGLPLPERLEGVSLRPWLVDPEAPAAKPAFCVLRPYDMDWLGLMVRTDRYKFVYWPNGMHQLYDMQADPAEYQNLLPDLQYGDVCRAHLGQLVAYGLLPAGP